MKSMQMRLEHLVRIKALRIGSTPGEEIEAASDDTEFDVRKTKDGVRLNFQVNGVQVLFVMSPDDAEAISKALSL